MAKDPTFEEVTACQRALFEWADSYDTKDWERLKKCVAPTLRIDYRSFLDKLWEAMPSDEFIMMASDPRFLGNPLLKTQHFIGLSTWQKVSDDEIVGTHQLRVPHQKYTDSSMREVAVKGHAHGTATMWYKRVEHEWKFAGNSTSHPIHITVDLLH
ncbi:Scytalone dehydratase [Rasamsonia emersonii CBS 393.64]|uniref:Scytalone dehydratase n=1 Tax=Rasamsonia emersonii (strain ATCC 16479 / CBS 393.64 / IMI 116815) TaxID=1408163 RepID=A0A0F4YIR1_RASE3|nr:Scytalone dehydratase [Rasamsonia emersonii CBS 393.64]KKA17756.1 Scytalone dehydratase [Rasamsonia emersonii CBS 393.64]